ncbi:hypothetical protein [Streptomyces sp. NPDC007264]|uniref:hypothetical protein n=1 Tax=Streptomyces sp. NPDC007264 TaxID=3364777 RepID=UPI0036D918C9
MEDEPTHPDEDPAVPDRTPRPADHGTGTPDPDSDASVGPDGLAATSPAPRQRSAGPARQAVASEPVVEILPLGSGLILVGLGLAIALLALRLRRE